MKYLAFIMVAMLVLVACSKEKDTEIIPVDEFEDSVRELPEVSETEAASEIDEEDEPEPQAVMSKELKNLLSLADTKVRSFSYVYTQPPRNAGGDTYYVKGDKMKIVLYDHNEWVKGEWYTTVYLDTAKKTAVGYCEDDNQIQCPDPDKQFALKYDSFVTKTNKDWLKDIPSSAKIVGKERFEQRNAYKVEFQEGVYTYQYFIDDFFGLPIEIRMIKDGKTDYYKFYELAGNALSDSDFVHKTAAEVSW